MASRGHEIWHKIYCNILRIYRGQIPEYYRTVLLVSKLPAHLLYGKPGPTPPNLILRWVALANKPQPIFPWATEWRNCSFWRIFGSSKLFKQNRKKKSATKKRRKNFGSFQTWRGILDPFLFILKVSIDSGKRLDHLGRWSSLIAVCFAMSGTFRHVSLITVHRHFNYTYLKKDMTHHCHGIHIVTNCSLTEIEFPKPWRFWN